MNADLSLNQSPALAWLVALVTTDLNAYVNAAQLKLHTACPVSKKNAGLFADDEE